MPIHTTRARRKFGKAPISPTRMLNGRCCAATRLTDALSGSTAPSGCSPRNLSVRCTRASSTQLSVGAAERSGAVASRIARRTSGSKLIARKRRTAGVALDHVEGSRPESARIDLDTVEPRAPNGVREGLERCAFAPALHQNAIELDACEIAMVPHAQVARDPQVAQRCFGNLDLTQPFPGHRRTIR